MEIFWLVAGIVTLGFATYLYFTNSEFEKLGYMYMAGSMAILLSIFRMVYRKYLNENPNKENNQ